jgi:hypothetical protein
MNLAYTKRSDGLIAVTFDNNVWDYRCELLSPMNFLPATGLADPN